jgi:Zn-dependent peptidase ImmA (M78 family)
MLASALLLPADPFKAEWFRYRAAFITANISPEALLKDTLNAVSIEFNVLHFTAARRARDLHIVSHAEYRVISTPVM